MTSTPDGGSGAPARLVLLTSSPRVAPGLLSGAAWSVLRSARVRAESAEHPLVLPLEAAGVELHLGRPDAEVGLAASLVAEARSHGVVVWLVDPEGEPGLGHALGEVFSGDAGGAADVELELLPGSYDLPGAAVLDLVRVMDRLRSPGGCAWDAEQTHASLGTYLLEETYETLEAIETGDRSHLREELGDLLLQVAFHSRIAAEHGEDPWSIDDVATDIVAKLVRRHPHVFAASSDLTAADVEARWDSLKAAEKGRTSVLEGVPMALPALTLAAKLLGRADRAGVDVPVAVQDDVGGRLLQLVADARDEGVDPEAALRAAARGYAERVRAAEVSGRAVAHSSSESGSADGSDAG